MTRRGAVRKLTVIAIGVPAEAIVKIALLSTIYEKTWGTGRALVADKFVQLDIARLEERQERTPAENVAILHGQKCPPERKKAIYRLARFRFVLNQGHWWPMHS